jgi:hypothetical protein
VTQERERERECTYVRERHTHTNYQPALTMGSMVDGILVLLYGEILRKKVVYCCTNEDSMESGGGELNNKFQISTYYEAGWLALTFRAGLY